MEDTSRTRMRRYDLMYEDGLEEELREEIHQELGLDDLTIEAAMHKLTPYCRELIHQFEEEGGYELGFKIFTAFDIMTCGWREILDYIFEGSYDSDDYKNSISYPDEMDKLLESIDTFFDYDDEVFDRDIFPQLVKTFNTYDEYIIGPLLQVCENVLKIDNQPKSSGSLRRRK